VLVGATILALGLLGLILTLVGSLELGHSNRETARAAEALRLVVERMRAIPPSEIFCTFNDDPTDDPGGEGYAPGDLFPLQTEAGRFSVQISFPTTNVPGELREDVNVPDIGMPRDLDGDGVIDALNHAGDYVQLPTRIRVGWAGANGRRSMELCTIFLNK
jgi:hypothetical protein